MGTFMKKIYIIATALLMLIGYNNCAQPAGNDLSEARKFENQGNGTPYGGKLSPGEYLPSVNQVCDSTYTEKIKVSTQDGKEKVTLEVPCEGSSVELSDNDMEVSNDKQRLMYNATGFAHESTTRAQAKEHYRLACRTTEANYGAEILIYGPAPVYTMEHISLQSGFTLYQVNLSFNYQTLTSPNRHTFVGDNDSFMITEKESGTLEKFNGSWDSTAKDTSEFRRVICDNLSGVPLDEW